MKRLLILIPPLLLGCLYHASVVAMSLHENRCHEVFLNWWDETQPQNSVTDGIQGTWDTKCWNYISNDGRRWIGYKPLRVLQNIKDYKSLTAKDLQNLQFPTSNSIVNCDFANTSQGQASSGVWVSGMGPIHGIAPVNADWYYNNDWGSAWRDEYIVEAVDENRIRQASCIFKDGTGYFFDIPPTGKWSSLYWHEHSIHIGHKGWSSLGNIFVREESKFPVKVSNIKELNFDVEYTYEIIGISNIHLALWFVDEKQINETKIGDEPFLEVVVKLKHNDKSCNEGSFKIKEQWWPYCYSKDGWTQHSAGAINHDFASLLIQLPNVNSGHNGTHTFNLKLKDLILVLNKKGYIKDHHTLLGLEFNNEMRYGRGVMNINSLDYQLLTKDGRQGTIASVPNTSTLPSIGTIETAP